MLQSLVLNQTLMMHVESVVLFFGKVRFRSPDVLFIGINDYVSLV